MMLRREKDAFASSVKYPSEIKCAAHYYIAFRYITFLKK